MQTTFTMSQLAAVSFFSGNKDIRYYLNGVFVEALAKETRLVATDGHTAAIARNVNEENPEQFSVIIPSEIVSLVIKTKATGVCVECKGEGDAVIWSINGIPFKPVDGKFPDYRRIVPEQVSGEVAQFNAEYTGRMAKAGKALKMKENFTLRHNGTGAAVAHFNNYSHFMAILMPVRVFTDRQPDTGLPTWAKN